MDHEPDWIWWSEARAIAARRARGASDAADDLAQELALERGADTSRVRAPGSSCAANSSQRSSRPSKIFEWPWSKDDFLAIVRKRGR